MVQRNRRRLDHKTPPRRSGLARVKARLAEGAYAGKPHAQLYCDVRSVELGASARGRLFQARGFMVLLAAAPWMTKPQGISYVGEKRDEMMQHRLQSQFGSSSAHMGVDFMTSDLPDIVMPACRKLYE